MENNKYFRYVNDQKKQIIIAADGKKAFKDH